MRGRMRQPSFCRRRPRRAEP